MTAFDDDLDVMSRAKAKAAETWKTAPAEPAPVERRRPSAMANPPSVKGEYLAVGVIALIVLAAMIGSAVNTRSAPETSERPAPPAVEQAPRFAPPTVAPVQESAPAPVTEPTPAPLPTGYIVGTEPAPVQLAPAAPQAAPIYVAPAPVADPWANASDLTPLEDEDNRGSMPKPCTHPRCAP
jgi:hypothetical protein